MSATPVIPDPRPVYERAAGQLATLIAATRPGDLDAPTPCAEYDVRSLLGHVSSGATRVANAAEGGTSEGEDVPVWTADLPADRWSRTYDEARARMTAAWADDEKLDALVTVPWGRMPGRIVLAGSVMETVAHSWDLAEAIGWEDPLDPELGEFALAAAHQALPAEGREHAPFGEVREVPEDADVYARLAAWLGRDPEWDGGGVRGSAREGLSALKDAVRGSVLVPDDEGYDEERGGFQLGAWHRPEVLVAARNAEDVQAAVDYAHRHGLPLAVQATGHGLSRAARKGVLISTRHMTGIRIDAEERTAWIEAGVRAADLVAEAARHGLAPVNGSAPGVGVVSYTLGGGVGLLGRQFGYAADHVRRIDLVTGDAWALQVTAKSDPELFWGLRGGGGGFGVVTGMEIGLVPVERIFGGRLVFDGGQVAEEVLRTWQAWTASVPEELTSAVTLLPMPDFPGVPEPLRGRYLAQVHIAFNGSPEEGEKLVGPLRSIGSLLVDELREMPYAESATVFSEPDTPRSYRSTNLLLSDALEGDVLRTVLREAGPDAEAMCVLGMRHLGGAFSRTPEVPNAVSNKEAAYLLGVLSPLEGPGEEAVRALHERVLSPAHDRMAGRSLNFLYGPQDEETVRPVFGEETTVRLKRLKAAHDPKGILQFNHWAPERD
ncbi:TIGR03086 family metal-binding protein [Streptomyces sp. NBC_01775]|uniref:TIGR03086 family metal-binding protein n=1 Tax=Streptomyces sp. NBC_01775 TaxID=2975939 RepID=UPI002DD8F781|nr:TIGR03086 family metal-binding protein [Streptomyces sp. NBC_01775]